MMKLLLALLIFVLIPANALAAPQTIDLETMTPDELIQLRTDVEAALLEQVGDKQLTVPMGVYVIGEHFPAGEYKVSMGKHFFSIEVYDDPNAKYPSFSEVVGKDTPTIGRVTMQDGAKLVIENGDAIFEKFAGLSF